ncbi:MAG TPA: hypothetical protein VIV64_09770 [Gammaproteobacteria bacterium]
MTVKVSEPDYLNFLQHTCSRRSANFLVVLEASRKFVGAIHIALVESPGFRLEGYSPRVLKICGRCTSAGPS